MLLSNFFNPKNNDYFNFIEFGALECPSGD